MRDKKLYIVLLIILFVFGALMYYLFGRDYHKNDSHEATIVTDNVVWSLNNNRWSTITNNTSLDSLNWKKYDVYVNHEKLGNYYLWKDNNIWRVFDDNKKALYVDGEILGINSNYNISVSKTNVVDVNDNSIFRQILEDNDVSLSNSNYNSFTKIPLDFDKDGIIEEFYILSNVFSEDSTYYSLAFMLKNDRLYYIYKNISSGNGFNGCKPYYNSFLDIDGDSKDELILSCSSYSVNGQSNILYSFDGEKFDVVISS